MRFVNVFVSYFILLVVFVSPTMAAKHVWMDGQNLNSTIMRTYSYTDAPSGHIQFCKYYKSSCKSNQHSTKRFAMTKKRWKQLVQINNYVNHKIKPVSDQDLYGKVEYWTFPTTKGDCEDYVVLKRRMLMKRGWPSGSLLITVVRDENGDGHAILTARTSTGDYVLDNKRDVIRPWNQIPYRFYKRQSSLNPTVWLSLMPQRTPRTISASRSLFSR